MRQYYVGSVKKITAHDAKFDGKYYEYKEKIDIVEKNVEFFYNRMGTLLRKDNKNPVVLEEELYDFFQSDFKYNDKKNYSYYCVNPAELIVVKSEEKNKVKLKSIFRR